MTEQMTPQQMAEELKENPLHTMVFFSPRLNTVTVGYDETADTAAEIEENLTAMGFQESGYGQMRYDGQRNIIAKTAEQLQAIDRARQNFESSTGTGYLRK